MSIFAIHAQTWWSPEGVSSTSLVSVVELSTKGFGPPSLLLMHPGGMLLSVSLLLFSKVTLRLRVLGLSLSVLEKLLLFDSGWVSSPALQMSKSARKSSKCGC